MIKNFFGGAVINYGDTLPTASGAPDGSLFFKTGAGAGLYIYSFLQDITPGTAGDQSVQQWSQLVAFGSLDATTFSGLGVGSFLRSDLTGLTTAAAPTAAFWTDSTTPQLKFTTNVSGSTGFPTAAGGTVTFMPGMFGNSSSTWLRTFDLHRDATVGSVPNLWVRGYDTVGNPTSWYKIITSASGGLDASTLNGQPDTFYRNASNINAGVLSTTYGGTGASLVLNQGGVIYGLSSGAMASTAAGTSSFLLQSNGTSPPTWVNPASLSVASASTANFANSATSATTAGSVSGTITFTNSGGAAVGTTYNGSSSPVISYATVGAPSTGGIGATGTWGINISGNATTATTASSATTATTATTATSANSLSAGQSFSIVGQVSASAVSFNGTAPVALNVTTLDAGNINAGTLPNARLSGTYTNITSLTASSTITGASLVATSVGTNGTARMDSGDASHTGLISFNTSANLRQGYIGYATTTNPTDTGTLNYVAGLHTFSGAASITGTLLVTGAISSNGNITAFSTSDRRMKEDIAPLTDVMEKIETLQGVSYTMKDTGRQEIGLIAQDVEEVVPEVVRVGGDGIYGIQYGNLVALLIEAVKTQQEQIKSLSDQVADLTWRVDHQDKDSSY
jgi:hypothetical protein